MRRSAIGRGSESGSLRSSEEREWAIWSGVSEEEEKFLDRETWGRERKREVEVVAVVR